MNEGQKMRNVYRILSLQLVQNVDVPKKTEVVLA